ncbi:2OG-Fe(II) oxygenase [Marinobacter salinus]|uniref:2OG-Fe(II) oxygenase n=2 Tax=Marinobacter salinus TaxID=1874317 RepID=A0A1D9GR90_9GAMM|nr:2OG-Fe(II) oxygenase [Marinobacter salinus]
MNKSLASPEDAACEQWLDTLADGLSEHGWMALDGREWVGMELLRALAAEVDILNRTDAMKKAGIGRGADLVRDRSVRRDRIAWLQGATPPQAALFKVLDRLREELNRRLFLGLKRFEAHYATYQSGDFYKKHLDSFQGRASRVVSLVLYLNEGWAAGDGGELQVFNRESENEVCGQVLPELGRMALFLSEEVPHEVLPANRTRYSLACWFRQDEVPLPL